MKAIYLVILLALMLACGCAAQTHEVADSTLQSVWAEYPDARPLLKVLFPDLFKLAVLDSTLFDGWKVYAANNGENYYGVQKINGNWTAIVDLGDSQGRGFAKAYINGDSLWVFSRGASTVPERIQELIDKLNQ